MVKNKMISFKKNVTYEELSRMIRLYEKNIIPSLSSSGINLDDYINKLYEKAITIMAMCEGAGVGIAAIYANDEITWKAYLSFISVEHELQGSGIGSELLKECEQEATRLKMKSLYLEVYKVNVRAFSFYKIHGYAEIGETSTSIIMMKELSA